MLKIGVVVGSTRPNRIGRGVADWVYKEASKRSDSIFEMLDIKDFNLPILDEPVPAGMSSRYTKPHTRNWSEKVSNMDAFIFVTPEYNHGPPAALKNALDFLYEEWNDKVAAFVGYGSLGGARSVEILRVTLSELQMATVRTQLAFFLKTDFENFKNLKPASHHVKTLNTMIEELISWGEALKSTRLTELESSERNLINKAIEQRPGMH